MPNGVVWLVLAACLLAGAGWAYWLGQPDFPFDDAYILQHSIDGLHKGGEQRFIGSSPLDGATSTAHALLVYLLSFFSPVGWAQILAANAAFVFFVVGVIVLARLEGLPQWIGAVTSVLAVIAGYSLYQFMNGLETGLAMAAIIWTFIAFHRPLPQKNWHGALLGILPLIRLELSALSLLIVIRALWAGRHDRQITRTASYLIGWAFVAALLALMFRRIDGGSLLPNTMSAKMYFFAQGCLPIIKKAQNTSILALWFLHSFGFAAVGFVGLAWSRFRLPAVAFIVILFGAYMLTLSGAASANRGRYLYLLAPFMVAGWLALLSRPEGRVRATTRLLFALAVAWSLVHLPTMWREYSRDITYSRSELAGMTQWVVNNIPPSDTILIHDAGYLSRHGEQPLVDLVGLKTPANIEINKKYVWSTCSHTQAAIEEIARLSGAKYFIVTDKWNKEFQFTTSLASGGWNVSRADMDRGTTAYKIYRLTPPSHMSSGSLPR